MYVIAGFQGHAKNCLLGPRLSLRILHHGVGVSYLEVVRVDSNSDREE